MRKWVMAIAWLVQSFLCAGLLFTTASARDAYPVRPVRAILPYSPGTTADLIARNLGPQLSESWKVPFIVDNRPGASGSIGVQAAMAAPPDGHTLLFVADNFTSAASINKTYYDPLNDLDPVILLARGDYALITPASFPAKNVAGLIAMARASPGTINYGSPGNGLAAHLMMELFKSTAGIDLVHVPYKNSAAAVTDVISGNVSLMFTSMSVALPLVAGGRVRMLAAGATKRTARAPDVPSLTEAGVMEYGVSTWYALLVRKNTPQEIKAKLNADIGALLRLPGVTELMSKQGIAAAGGTPEELRDLIRTDFERWNKVVRDSKITAD